MKSVEPAETRAAVSSVTTAPAAGQQGGAPRGWTARAAGVLRYHWLAAVLLLAGLVLRVLAQFAYRPALFLDAVRYLYNAYGNDPVGYEGPLRAILWVDNLNAVVPVQ